MDDMHKGLAGRPLLAQLLEDERFERGWSWTELAEKVGVTTQTLREARYGSDGIGDVTQQGIERVMRWRRGSVEAILAGGRPTPLPPVAITSLATVTVTGNAPRIRSAFEEAVQADETLLPEAKSHLLNQYSLLQRLSEASDTNVTPLRPTQRSDDEETVAEHEAAGLGRTIDDDPTPGD